MVVTARKDGRSFDGDEAMTDEETERLAAETYERATGIHATNPGSQGAVGEIASGLMRARDAGAQALRRQAAAYLETQAAAIESEDALAAHLLRSAAGVVGAMELGEEVAGG